MIAHPIENLLIVEYVGGGGMMGETIHPSLLSEGDAILGVLLRGFQKHQQKVTYSRDPRLAPHEANYGECVFLAQDEDPLSQWHRLCRNHDAFLPLAPETDKALASLCTIAPPHCQTLSSDKKAIDITSSKTKSTQHLAPYLSMMPAYSLSQARKQTHNGTGTNAWVVKPDDGAGSVFNFHLQNDKQLQQWQAPDDSIHWIATPFMEGETLSLSLFYQKDDVHLIAINRQHMITNQQGQMNLHKIEVAIETNLSCEAQTIARIMGEHLSLWGMVGVDVIAQGKNLMVVDINPRLTSSCVDLEEKTGFDWIKAYIT